MALLNLIFPALYSFVFVASLHPIHVSVTDIEFDEKDKALEIMMRVFMDDLEITMRKRLQEPDLDILSPKHLTLDEMMADYVKEKVRISLDNKLQKLNYLGHERDGDAFIFYIEVSNVKKWKEIQVMNTFLHETYGDQSNLVHVTVRGKIKSMRLVKGNPSDKLSFE